MNPGLLRISDCERTANVRFPMAITRRDSISCPTVEQIRYLIFSFNMSLVGHLHQPYPNITIWLIQARAKT